MEKSSHLNIPGFWEGTFYILLNVTTTHKAYNCGCS